MTEIARSTTTDSRHRLRIFINNEPYFAPDPVMIGAEILTLASLPDTNQLFLEVAGPADDLPIGPEQPVNIRPGMKFYDVPVGTFG
jgi:hypothetical protein